MPFVWFGLFVAIIAIAIVVGYYLEKKRTEQLAAAAAELGFEFLLKTDNGFLGQAGNSEMFKRGHSHTYSNILRGVTNDLKVTIFDFRYVTGSGKHKQTHNQTAVAFQFDGPTLPTFTLEPEHFGHRIAQWFGSQDIDFESHPKFSKGYLLRGPDEDAIRELFRPDVLEFFEEEPGACVAGVGNHVVYFRHRTRIDPAKIRQLLEAGFRVYGTLRAGGDAGGQK